MTETFPKSHRLLSRSDFTSLFHRKKSFTLKDRRDSPLVLDWAFSSFCFPRIGITVTKKQGGSVERNRLKRLVREAFRTSSLSKQNIGVDLNLRVKGPLIHIRQKDMVPVFSVDLQLVQELFVEFEEYVLSITKRKLSHM